eukprot:245639_1
MTLSYSTRHSVSMDETSNMPCKVRCAVDHVQHKYKWRRFLNLIDHKLRKPSNKPRKMCIKKKKYRPSLRAIWTDPLLFNALVQFCQKSFNSENILFLQSVKNLKRKPIDHLDKAITSIYDSFIQHGAQYQINLSSACFVNIMSKRSALIAFDAAQKYSLFDLCVAEIERLVVTSILSAFYCSSFFCKAAKQIRK